MQHLAWLIVILFFLWIVIRVVEKMTLKEKAEYHTGGDLARLFSLPSSYVSLLKALCTVILILWVSVRG